MTGEFFLLLGLVGLVVAARRAGGALGMSPLRLVLWGGLLLAGGAVTLDVPGGPLQLSVNAGGTLVPLAGAIAWSATVPAEERRRGLWAMVAVAAVGFALLRVFRAEPPPPWIPPPVLTGVTAGVIAALLPHELRTVIVAAAAGLLVAQCGVALDLALATEPVSLAVGGAEGYDALVVGVTTGGALALLGKAGDGRP
ncbi:MAG: hypothetical protein DIU69_01260 [Bacillota bacterium]|nr:MAG: hypothetical protein DIU69_01260 [Bacillota bacterium]